LDLKGFAMTRYTPEDLLQYLYKETSVTETSAIEQALKEDWTLREKLEVLKESVRSLDGVLESPRTQVVLNVLNYARQTMGQTA
jgi:hypothetical protein